MSYPLSDEDSTDSDSGIRFKTASTRNKLANVSSEKRSAIKDRDKYTNRRDNNQSSSRQNSHRSYRDRSRDRYDSRSRRERSRSREYKDEHRKKVHRNRSPDNSLNSQRRDDEHKRSEKSSRKSKQETTSSRSRDNSHDRINVERGKSKYCDDKATVKHTRITYKSLSDEDVKKIKRKESEYDSDSFRPTKLEKRPEIHCRNTSSYAPSEDDSPIDSPQSDLYSRYTNSSKTITISGSEDTNSEKCGPIISPQKNKHGKSSKKLEKNIESTPSVRARKKCNREYMRSALSSQNIKSEQSDDTCYGPTLPPIKLNLGCHKDVNTKTGLPLEIKKSIKYPEKLDDCYGPSLPSLMKTDSDFDVQSNEKENSKSPDISDKVQGPVMPTDLLKSNQDIAIGPALTPNLPKANSTNSIKEINQHEDCDEDIGPALPPHLQKAKLINSIRETIQNGDDDQNIEPTVCNTNKSEKCNEISNSSTVKQVIGPAIPAHFRAALLEEAENNTEIIQPEEDQCESEDDVIGPLPAGHSGKNSSYNELEERALQMKIDSLNQSNDNRTVREEWMLELPQVRAANLGLGPRQFRAKGVPDMSDRSSWTDTPQDKAKKKVEPPKVDIKKEAELKMIQDRDLEQQKMVEKHKKKKKRDKSLLDAHQEEYNKKKKKEQVSGKSERRPFNRDIDLKANRFDEAQKKSILKKAQLLDNRFSSGESKFL